MQNIILLHGAIGAVDQLEPLKSELTALGYTCYSFNFSGHGPTPYAESFGIKQFSVELEKFIAGNTLEKPDVFGYSMGGYVALYLASQQPELIGKIITLGTKFDWDPIIAQGEAKMLDTQIIMDKIPKFAASLKQRHGDNWELLMKKTAAMMIDLGNENLLDEETLAKITNKVWIGLADADSMVSAEETDLAVSGIKNAQRYTLENTKHPIESVDKKKLAELISGFIRL
jgi:pimeloyl-ACP methyl ester carboxylesterase